MIFVRYFFLCAPGRVLLNNTRVFGHLSTHEFLATRSDCVSCARTALALISASGDGAACSSPGRIATGSQAGPPPPPPGRISAAAPADPRPDLRRCPGVAPRPALRRRRKAGRGSPGRARAPLALTGTNRPPRHGACSAWQFV